MVVDVYVVSLFLLVIFPRLVSAGDLHIPQRASNFLDRICVDDVEEVCMYKCVCVCVQVCTLCVFIVRR